MVDLFEGHEGCSDHWDAKDLFGYLMSHGSKKGLLFEALQSASLAVERKRLRENLENISEDAVAKARASLEPSYFIAKKLYLESKEHTYPLGHSVHDVGIRH